MSPARAPNRAGVANTTPPAPRTSSRPASTTSSSHGPAPRRRPRRRCRRARRRATGGRAGECDTHQDPGLRRHRHPAIVAGMDFAGMIHPNPTAPTCWWAAVPVPWGGLYGGQIVAQALRAGRSTVDAAFARTRCGPTSSGRATTGAGPLRGRPHPQRALVLHPPGRRPPGGRRHPEPRGELPRRRGARRCRASCSTRRRPGPTASSTTRGPRPSSGASSPSPRVGRPGPVLVPHAVGLGDDRWCTPPPSPTCPTTSRPTPWSGPMGSAGGVRTAAWFIGLARPHDLVPPAGAGRRVAPAGLHLPWLPRRAGAGHSGTCSPGRRPRGDRRPGGARATAAQ